MKVNCFINGLGSVSAQDSLTYKFFVENAKKLTKNVVHVHKPNYRDYIKPAMIRRMQTGVKMGVVASTIALNEANIENPEAIVTGTGMGCLLDSEKFLKNIIDNDEQYLTPTSFIQSTHNTVGGQIALGLQCKSYNVTYVHSATSFESSLIDALLLLNENKKNILVGGIDELGEHTIGLHKIIEHIKEEGFVADNILESDTKGAIFSEGAQFFCLENKQETNTYAKLIDVAICDVINTTKEIEQKLIEFLKDNQLKVEDLDLVFLGINGDVVYDIIYKKLQQTLFKKTQQVYYKHLSGEYNTVASFGLWLASNICKTQNVPTNLKINTIKVTTIKNVLLYNQYRGKNHSFTLLQSC